MGKSVMIREDIWKLITAHYRALQESGQELTKDESSVISYIIDKEVARMKHDSYIEDRDRQRRISNL